MVQSVKSVEEGINKWVSMLPLDRNAATEYDFIYDEKTGARYDYDDDDDYKKKNGTLRSWQRCYERIRSLMLRNRLFVLVLVLGTLALVVKLSSKLVMYQLAKKEHQAIHAGGINNFLDNNARNNPNNKMKKTSLQLQKERFEHNQQLISFAHTDIDQAKGKMGPLIFGTQNFLAERAIHVENAILAGFKHIVTGSDYHSTYNESAVGIGIQKAIQKYSGKGTQTFQRTDLFLQTHILSPDNPEWTNPLIKNNKSNSNHHVSARLHVNSDEKSRSKNSFASLEEYVRSSIERSFVNLQTNYLDAVLYHNDKNKPTPMKELIVIWKIMEEYVEKGKIRYLGITNINDVNYFDTLYYATTVKPTIVQNRFHNNRNYGVGQLRDMFISKGVTEQLFWALTGNENKLKEPIAKELATKFILTTEQFMFAFILSIGDTRGRNYIQDEDARELNQGFRMQPLIGSTNLHHMKQDMDVAKAFLAVKDPYHMTKRISIPSISTSKKTNTAIQLFAEEVLKNVLLVTQT